MNSTKEDVKRVVKEHYGQAALQAKSGARSCCGPSSSCCSVDPITKDLFSSDETAALPEETQRNRHARICRRSRNPLRNAG